MPPKGKKSKPSSDAKYLFVNEDANTVLSNTRDVDLDRTKQSHVQRRQFAKKRDKVANAARAQSSRAHSSLPDEQGLDALSFTSVYDPPGGLLSSSDYFNLFDPSTIDDDLLAAPIDANLYGSLRFHQFQAGPFAATSQPPSPSFAAERQAPASTLSPESRRGSSQSGNTRDERPTSRRRGRAPSNIATSPNPSPVDPFSSTFLALERWAPPLIKYYTTVVVPQMFATELKTMPMQLMRHTPALHADMQTCMAEAAHMYALLSAVSARMLRYEGRLLLPDVRLEDYARVPLFFKTKAIPLLRQKLERGQLDRLLAQDVFRLMAASVYMNDKAGVDAHFQALIEMVRNLGGLETFEDYIKERIILVDIWQASWTLSKPKLHLSWDPGHLPQDFHTGIRSDEYNFLLGSGFDRPETSHIFNPQFLNLMSGLTEVIDLTRYSFAHPLASNNFQWLLLRRAAIEYRLLSSINNTVHNGNLVVESTKITTLIWINMVLAEENKQLLAHQVNTLRTRLESHDITDFGESHVKLLLWISSTCALATIDEDDKEWFTGIASRLARKLEIDAIEDMEELLHGLLYVAEMQRDSLAVLMNGFGDYPKGKGAAGDHG